jgi:hypothetical protein
LGTFNMSLFEQDRVGGNGQADGGRSGLEFLSIMNS